MGYSLTRWLTRGAGTLAVQAALLGSLLGLAPVASLAIPSYARQSGLPCNACHVPYPQLNAFGREFKLMGYTLQGTEVPFYERFAGMAEPAFTHTAADIPGGAAPHFSDNNNFSLNQASIFYGGRLLDALDKLGTFIQVTYDGVSRTTSWDNTDIRFADSASPGGTPVTYGITLNNNPSVQDLWNTTPAWEFPFSSSGLAPAPAAAPLIQGTLAGTVVGIGGYAMWNNLVYAEADVYQTPGTGFLKAMGIGSSDIDQQLDGGAPYWRFALQKSGGLHAVSAGTFGLLANTYPGSDQSAGTSDRYLDVGFDLQYQYTNPTHYFTGRATWIGEDQTLNASVPLGLADNHTNHLYTLALSGTYLYDQTYSFSLGYNFIRGSADAALYGTSNGSPDSNYFTVQADWLPLNKHPLETYPWFNPKLTAQYVHYAEFDGTTSNASDNDTLYLQVWLVF